MLKLRNKNYNSISLGIFLCANPLSWLLTFDNGIVAINFLCLTILLINNDLRIFINKKLFLVVGAILLFLYSYILNSETDKLQLYLLSFFSFGFVGILYSSCEINYRYLILTIFFISIVTIPGILKTDQLVFVDNLASSGYYMGRSYGCLRLLLTLFLIVYYSKIKSIKIVSIILILLYLNFYLFFGNRGAILSIILFLLFHYLINRDKLSMQTILILVICVLLLQNYFIDILKFINDIFNSVDLKVKAIDKILMFNEEGKDLSNGRSELYNYAFNDISENLIFGNGISTFDIKYGMYPHNVFIQILYEGGIFYLLFFLIVFLRFFKIILSDEYKKEYKIFLLFIFFSGITELFFSSVYWRSMFFWFFISMLFNSNKLIKKLYNE